MDFFIICRSKLRHTLIFFFFIMHTIPVSTWSNFLIIWRVSIIELRCIYTFILLLLKLFHSVDSVICAHLVCGVYFPCIFDFTYSLGQCSSIFSSWTQLFDTIMCIWYCYNILYMTIQ